MVNDNKIDAIKAVRALGYGKFEVVRNPETGVQEIHNKVTSLREAKDLVEDIMALGVTYFLKDQLIEQARKQKETARYRAQQADPKGGSWVGGVFVAHDQDVEF